MSEDPDQEHFADGISEDLITGLSRIHWLFVIARNSTFVYKNRAVDVKQVARELGVRYVLEGSVRRAGKRIRINAQLIDAMTGGHHWAERYDRELGDIFAVQDEITRSVVAAIEPRLLAAEGIRTLSRSPDDLGAWERVARAQTYVWRLTRADYAAAIKGARTGGRDLSGLRAGAKPCWRFACCLRRIWDGSIANMGCCAGRQHAIRAIALDDCDSWGQIALGYLGDDGAAHRGVDRGISPRGRTQSEFRESPRRSRHGRWRLPGRTARRSRRWKTRSGSARWIRTWRCFSARSRSRTMAPGDTRTLSGIPKKLLRSRPGFQGAQRLRCASLAQTGRIDEARSFLATVRREQPQLSIDWIRASVPYQTPELMERFLEGMRKAGLNET